ncbi:hypothetical protein AB4Y42_08725 [Paraburkholderia sp. EG286B]|uniref:hypothetical protein n=1 Tax=Paraburkholderia sp. EG286B TaxID=3237011 RepID=UPI0034D2D959
MKVRIANEGDAPISLIVDGDEELQETVEAGAELLVAGDQVELRDPEAGQYMLPDE